MTVTRLTVLLLVVAIGTAAALPNLAGIRGVQMRSNQVVTVWLGYASIDDSTKLYDPEMYTISSPNDPAYADSIHPVSVSRFSKGSRSANGPFDRRVLMDHFMHLKVETPFKPHARYVVTVEKGLIPDDMPRTGQFRLDHTPNPGFKLNQVGYANTATRKYVYLS